MDEIEYVDDPFDNDWDPRKLPAWAKPTNEWEERILAAVDLERFPNQKLQKLVHLISTNCYPWGERESKFPEEWIINCCTWARKKREKREMVQLVGLVSLLYNEARRDQFMERWNGEVDRFVPPRR